jgi:peptidoglycan LD-endopeptidase LytH
MRRLTVAVVCATALSLVVHPSVVADELEEADRRVERLQGELGDVTDGYERTWAELEATRSEVEELRQQAEELAEVAEDVEQRLGDRARSTYMHGSTATLQTLLASDGPQVAIERASLVATLQLRETAGVEEAVAVRASLDQTEQLLEDRLRTLDDLQERLDAEAAALGEELEAAEQQAHDLRTLGERQRRIDRGEQQGIYACIFDPGAARFRDTWGHPRSGGRSHKGTDVFARMDEPVYAITAGVVERRSSSPLGGLGLYLRGDDGNVYYYAHLNAIADAGAVGTRVEAGEHIAYNGATGNASPSAPHVHFELHPGGGAAVNPYPWLAAACHG